MNKTGKLRIIGGDWRGRALHFTAKDGLRPTADRVRETLFNWLAPRIYDAVCLDMFAGSGALGLEALSRGAKRCDFIERDRASAQAITRHLSVLQATPRGRVIQGDALKFQAPHSYDVVFIDPPFAENLQQQALNWLLNSNMLTSDARIYLECSIQCPEPKLDKRLHLLRSKKAGGVRYQLLALATT